MIDYNFVTIITKIWIKIYPKFIYKMFLIGNEDEGGSDQDEGGEGFVIERRFPSLEQQAEDSESNSPGYKGVTVQEIIAQR